MCQWFTNDALGTVGVGANSIGTLAEGAWVILFLQNSSNGLFTPLNPYDIWPISTQSTCLKRFIPFLIYENFVWHPRSDAFFAFKIRRSSHGSMSSYCILTDVTMAPTLLLWSLQATNISPPKVCLNHDFLFLQVRYGSSLQGHFLMYLYQSCWAILTVVSPKVVSAGHLVKLREWWIDDDSVVTLTFASGRHLNKKWNKVVNIPPVDGKESGKPCKHQLRLVLDSFDFFVLANITIVCPHVVWMLYGGGVEWRYRMTCLALQSYNICCLSLWDGNVLARSAFLKLKWVGYYTVLYVI